MRLKDKDLEFVLGGLVFWDKVKTNWKLAIGTGLFITVVGFALLIAFIVLKKKKKATEHCRQETINDWETITHWYRNEQGEIMISI